MLDPDIIGITESWVDDKIVDEEIGTHGYELFRCDRPRNITGSGVVLYVRGSFNASMKELKMSTQNKYSAG